MDDYGDARGMHTINTTTTVLSSDYNLNTKYSSVEY